MFEVKKASDGQFYFNLKASNGKVVLTSERYTDKRSAQKGIESVRKNAANSARFERKQRTGGQPSSSRRPTAKRSAAARPIVARPA